MNVAIISLYRAVVPHFETELDIAQQHLDAGDTVEFLQCSGQLEHCEFNPHHEESRCRDCVGRRKMGLELLDRPCQTQTMDRLPLTLEPSLKCTFSTVEELKAYRVDGFDLGYAVLSSLVSECRDADPNLQDHGPTLARLIRSAWWTYQQTLRWLEAGDYDCVYVYNGRFAALRAVLRACQKLGVECRLHERGCDAEHYELLVNHLPHDLEKIEAAIRRRWSEAAEDAQREDVARSWFEERRQRVEKVWHSFTKEQQEGRLPADWDPQCRQISIFCSSDDEFVAIGDAWNNELYPNQVDAIERIAVDLAKLAPEIKLYLRMHPNLKGVDNARCRRMREFSLSNLTVIPPEDPCDTYALVEASDTVVSFGSSVGSEALYWGTPSVLLGPCFYQNLGGVWRPKTHDETLELLSRTLEAGDPEAALKYGFWFQTRGFPHRYFRADGLFEGKFKGQTVYARPTPLRGWQRWKRRFRRLWRSPAA